MWRFFFFQAEDGIRDKLVTGVQTCALPISFVVQAIERKEKKRNPVAPFITSRLQQEAARKLRFSPKKTMTLAQQLYEGMDIGKEGPLGLITYMRTDSDRKSTRLNSSH